MFERFTNQSRRVVVLAQEEARLLNHNYIGTEHLLLGLLQEGKGSAARALTATGVTLPLARDRVVATIGRGQEQRSGHIPFTPHAKKSLELSLREALQLGDGYIGTGHLLLGLLHESSNMAIKLLGELGTDLKDLRVRVLQEMRSNPEERDAPSAERERQQLRVFLRGSVQELLDSIDSRLSAIEQHLGLTRPVPPASAALRSLDERLVQVRRDKEAAIDVQDFGQAAELREAEKQLIAERARLEEELAAAVVEEAAATDAVEAATADAAAADGAAADGAVADEDAAAGEVDELTSLRARLARLEALWHKHGLDPDEPREPPAATA